MSQRRILQYIYIYYIYIYVYIILYCTQIQAPRCEGYAGKAPSGGKTARSAESDIVGGAQQMVLLPTFGSQQCLMCYTRDYS